MYKSNLRILGELREQLEEYSKDKASYCQRLVNFTKAKKLPFVRVFLIITSLLKKTLCLELYDCFNQEGLENFPCTTSAFSQARKKLKSSIFIAMNARLLDLYYCDNEERVIRWKGFRLHAVDGSTINLPEQEEVINHFGGQYNQYRTAPMARIHSRYDVLNKLIVRCSLTPYARAERVSAWEDIANLEKDTLSIYDRGYAGFAFFYYHNLCNQEYVCRVSLTFNSVIKDFVASGEASAIVCFKATDYAIKCLKAKNININKKTELLVRLVRVILPNGEIEILATSLLDEAEYPNSIFKELYALRWGVETFYDLLKNKFQIELFSGHSVLSIFQDFYATIFVTNIHSLLIQESETIVQEKIKHRKRDYKINRNVSLGLLKGHWILLFIAPNLEAILEKLEVEFCKHLVPVNQVILGTKSSKRIRRSRNIQGKYVALSNYKRAI